MRAVARPMRCQRPAQDEKQQRRHRPRRRPLPAPSTGVTQAERVQLRKRIDEFAATELTRSATEIANKRNVMRAQVSRLAGFLEVTSAEYGARQAGRRDGWAAPRRSSGGLWASGLGRAVGSREGRPIFRGRHQPGPRAPSGLRASGYESPGFGRIAPCASGPTPARPTSAGGLFASSISQASVSVRLTAWKVAQRGRRGMGHTAVCLSSPGLTGASVGSCSGAAGGVVSDPWVSLTAS
jgi:hypothetical protein